MNKKTSKFQSRPAWIGWPALSPIFGEEWDGRTIRFGLLGVEVTAQRAATSLRVPQSSIEKAVETYEVMGWKVGSQLWVLLNEASIFFKRDERL